MQNGAKERRLKNEMYVPSFHKGTSSFLGVSDIKLTGLIMIIDELSGPSYIAGLECFPVNVIKKILKNAENILTLLFTFLQNQLCNSI